MSIPKIRARKVGAAAALLAGLALIAPASAHTNIVIAAFQISPGGYVNGVGVAPNQQIDQGPATDGTIAWTNLDPVPHTLVGVCTDRPSSGSPRCVKGDTYFTVTLQPGGGGGVQGLPLGTYEYSDPDWPTMQAMLRVTSQE